MTFDPVIEKFFQVTMQFQTSMDDLLFLSAIDQLTVFLEVPDGGPTWPAQGMREVEPGLTTFVAPGNRSFEISLSGDYVRENAVMLAGRNAVSVFLFPDGQEPVEGLDEVRVSPDMTPGDLLRLLPATAPEHGESLGLILDDADPVAGA